jgi:glycosyltransferase involved in cell wall biosynthesis
VKNQFPLVSIIITSYNRADLIGKAIKSALEQDYPNLEIIISDNCSTDNSDEVIRKYVGDKRIRYSRNETNIGMIPNYRKAVYELAKGEYLSFISSDDCLADPIFISDSIRLVNKYDNVQLVFGRSRAINEKGEVFNESPQEPYFVREFWDGKDAFFTAPDYGFMSWAGCLMNKLSLHKIKGLQTENIYIDLECNYKLMLEGNVCCINRICYQALWHDNSATTSVSARDKISFIECFNDIRSFAREVLPNDTARIDRWKRHFVYVSGHNSLKFLKERNEEEFRILRDYIYEKHPEEYNDIFTLRYKSRILLNGVKQMFKKLS